MRKNQSPCGMFLLPLSFPITPRSAIEKWGKLTYYVRKGNFGFWRTNQIFSPQSPHFAGSGSILAKKFASAKPCPLPSLRNKSAHPTRQCIKKMSWLWKQQEKQMEISRFPICLCINSWEWRWGSSLRQSAPVCTAVPSLCGSSGCGSCGTSLWV